MDCEPFCWEGCARNAWEFNKTDRGLSHHSALECVGESQGDGQGELKAEAPFSSLNFPLTNLKGLKSFSERDLEKMVSESTLMTPITEFVNSCVLAFGC